MATAAQAAHEIPEKSLFRIGEVSRLTATKTFVLRYWETEFPMLLPVKSPTGHRLYRREDIETVFEIKRLLYQEGFTIAGARKHLAEHGGRSDAAQAETPSVSQPHPSFHAHASPARSELSFRIDRQLLLDLREELRAALTLLEGE